MASYALASGKPLAPRIAEVLQDHLLGYQASSAADREHLASTVGDLTWAHGELSRLVAPAAPRAVLLLAPEPAGEGFRSIFGPIRLVRCLLVLSLLSLAGLLLLGATEEVTVANTSTDIFALVGLPSLMNAGFLLCAASIGATFSALFRINLYIAATTYDPKHDASYWVQYGLGLIAGALLATLVPMADAPGSSFTRPVLALVGGFSASLLYRVLDRLSRSIESVVAGHPPDDASTSAAAPGTASGAEDVQKALNQLAALMHDANGIREASPTRYESATGLFTDGHERRISQPDPIAQH
jgi:hypothetical protein